MEGNRGTEWAKAHHEAQLLKNWAEKQCKAAVTGKCMMLQHVMV